MKILALGDFHGKIESGKKRREREVAIETKALFGLSPKFWLYLYNPLYLPYNLWIHKC